MIIVLIRFFPLDIFNVATDITSVIMPDNIPNMFRKFSPLSPRSSYSSAKTGCIKNYWLSGILFDEPLQMLKKQGIIPSPDPGNIFPVSFKVRLK